MQLRPPSPPSSSMQAAGPSHPEVATSVLPVPRSIRGKLIFGLFIVSMLGIIATSTAIYAMWRIEDKVRIIESFYELNQNILEVRRYEKNYLLFNDSKDLLSALDYVDQVRASIARIKNILPRGIEGFSSGYDLQLSNYESVFRQLMNTGISHLKRQSLQNELREYGQDITREIFDLDTRARIRVEREVSNYQRTAVIILTFAIMAGGIFIIYLVNWITRPLEAIREASARIMQGEMSSIPITEEIGDSIEGMELVNSLNRMLESLNTKQDQLVQSAKLAAIGKVTAGIAHEINNPLNNISLTAEVLLEDLPNLECDERLEMVSDILMQADRAREVVHHLLEFSRNRKSGVIEPIDLGKLVEESIILLKNQFRLSGISCQFIPPGKKVTVRGNANQLQQVLVNMMLNAVQAMQAGGRLTIVIREKEREALLEVADTGSGIPKKVLANIFDPFFTTKSEGTGLGLSLSFAIIRDHHGDIEVESEQGKGTTFIIHLPITNEESHS
jgi:two-component system NtrC family sensor kinase